MLLLTEDAVIVCKHQLGRAENRPSQSWVRIAGRRVLVAPDPEGRGIAGCPHLGPAIKPCLLTLKVKTGYSEWVRIGGQAVSLDTVSGFTDGTPPGVVLYVVDEPGQAWVAQS